MFSVDRWDIFLNRKHRGVLWLKLLAMRCIGVKALFVLLCSEAGRSLPISFSLFFFLPSSRHIRGFPERGIIPTTDCWSKKDIYTSIHIETLMTTKPCQQKIIPFSGSHHIHLCYLLVSSLMFHLSFFFHISLKQDQWWASGFPLTEPWQELPEVSWQRECQVAASFFISFFSDLLTCR